MLIISSANLSILIFRELTISSYSRPEMYMKLFCHVFSFKFHYLEGPWKAGSILSCILPLPILSWCLCLGILMMPLSVILVQCLFISWLTLDLPADAFHTCIVVFSPCISLCIFSPDCSVCSDTVWLTFCSVVTCGSLGNGMEHMCMVCWKQQGSICDIME